MSSNTAVKFNAVTESICTYWIRHPKSKGLLAVTKDKISLAAGPGINASTDDLLKLTRTEEGYYTVRQHFQPLRFMKFDGNGGEFLIGDEFQNKPEEVSFRPNKIAKFETGVAGNVYSIYMPQLDKYVAWFPNQNKIELVDDHTDDTAVGLEKVEVTASELKTIGAYNMRFRPADIRIYMTAGNVNDEPNLDDDTYDEEQVIGVQRVGPKEAHTYTLTAATMTPLSKYFYIAWNEPKLKFFITEDVNDIRTKFELKPHANQNDYPNAFSFKSLATGKFIAATYNGDWEISDVCIRGGLVNFVPK